MAFSSVTLSSPPALPQPITPDEPALLARVRAGDLDALSQVYRQYADQVLALAARLTGSRSDAEDVVQDLFVGLPRALLRYDERGRFLPWLKRLAVRGALVRMRAGRRRQETELAEVESFWVNDTAGDGALREALERLPSDDRGIIVLKVVEGYSHEEIAALLGIRRGTSEVRLHRALERLRSQLKEKP
jgi:RNA polymerase sigma-70 factor (ECF subfamily)